MNGIEMPSERFLDELHTLNLNQEVLASGKCVLNLGIMKKFKR